MLTRLVVALAAATLAACGSPQAGPSPIADAPPPGTVSAPSTRALPAGLDPAYVQTIAIIDPSGIPKRWEGGPFHHCVAAEVDRAVVERVADRMTAISGIPRTEAGPCNVTWIVERSGANRVADSLLYGTPVAIYSARVRFETERGATMENATHESGHVLGLGHSAQQGDSMCADTTSGPERNLCAPFPVTFSPLELAVLAWIYSGK